MKHEYLFEPPLPRPEPDMAGLATLDDPDIEPFSTEPTEIGDMWIDHFEEFQHADQTAARGDKLNELD